MISDWLGGTVQSRRSHRKEEGGKLSFCDAGTDINVLIKSHFLRFIDAAENGRPATEMAHPAGSGWDCTLSTCSVYLFPSLYGLFYCCQCAESSELASYNDTGGVDVGV